MKKAIFLLGVLISFYGLGQTQYAPLGSPFGNTINRINAQYGFQLPRGTDTSLKGSLDTVGMLFYKTTDTSLWLRVPKVSGVGNMWKKLNFSAGTIGNTIYTGNGSLSGDRTVNGGTNILTFNNLLRYYLQTSGDINISTTNSSNSNIGLNSAQSVSIYSANGNINNTSNGNITNDASGGHRFLSSGIFAPSLTNAISDKRLMYNSSTGEFTYADTTVGGGGTNYWDLTGTDIANNNSGNVTIGQNSTSRLTVDSTGSLNWYSNDPYFNLDGANRRFQIGDYTYDWYGTRIDVNDDFAARYIKNYAQNFYVIGDSVYTNGLMSAKDRNGIIEMGDINNDVNSTNLTLNDSAQSIIYKANNGHYFSTGQIFAPSISNAVSDKQLMYNSSTGEFAYADTIQINNLLKTKVDTSIRVIAGIDLIGGGSLSSNITLNADTSTGASKLATQGFVTRNSTGGTVTTLTKTNGIGTSITITNPTTTPNIKVDVDTIVVSTKANVTKDSAVLATAINGKIDSIRLVNTGVIFTTPAAYSKAGTTGVITQTLANQTAYKVLWNNTSGSAAPAFNYLDSNAFNNQFAIQVKAAQTPSNTYTAGRGTTLTSGAFGLDTTKGYTWTAGNTFSTSVTTPTIYGGTGANSGLNLYSTSNASPSNPNDINFYTGNGGAATSKLNIQGTTGVITILSSLTSTTSNDLNLKAPTGNNVIFYPNNTYLGGYNGTTLTVSNAASTAGKIVVGKNGSGDFASACAEFTSTTRGILPNRWTTSQMNAISSPATGLMGYNTDALMMLSYNGTAYKSNGIVSGSFSGTGTATTTFTVTFGGTQPNSTYKVNVTPTNALSAALFYVTNKTTTTFDVMYLAGLTGGVAFDYSLTQ